MAKPSTLSINVKAILKDQLNPHGDKLFLNCAVWKNKDGPGTRGDTHYITQEVSKEARERGIKGAILGNLKLIEDEDTPRQQEPIRNRQQPRTEAPAKAEKEDFDF